MKFRFPPWKFNATALTAWIALWCLLALNVPFWSKVLQVRPITSVEDALYLGSFALLAFLAINLFLMPLTLVRPMAKPLFALVVLLAGFSSYFVSSYGILIDKVMIRNVFETNGTEAGELINFNLILYVGLLGVLPAFLVMRAGVIAVGVRREVAHRGIALGLTVMGIGLVAAAHYQDHASTLRNNRELRHMLVPVNYLAGLGSYVREITRPARPYQPIGRDARLGDAWKGSSGEKPLIMVFVVGETARAADFGLDGYVRQTTPKLSAIPDLVNFSKVSSCGTSTAISVPCMFSDLGRERFDPEEAKARDNLINIVQRVGFEVQWFGNNTSCQGVCRDVPETRVRREDYPQYCVGESPCMDGAMFDMFGKTLANTSGRRFVVLHMLGNHGPGYHLRYPKEFEKFTPVCRETDFSKCDLASIVNAYDNEILYTDHLLAETIRQLAALGDRADTALIYVSDHGESLGESGIFLHALPYPVAPEVQTHVPMLFWASPDFASRMGIDMSCLAQTSGREFSHDNLFHSVLGVLNVDSSAKRDSLSMFVGCKK